MRTPLDNIVIGVSIVTEDASRSAKKTMTTPAQRPQDAGTQANLGGYETGTRLIEAFQAIPDRDVEIEPAKSVAPVRDIDLMGLLGAPQGLRAKQR